MKNLYSSKIPNRSSLSTGVLITMLFFCYSFPSLIAQTSPFLTKTFTSSNIGPGGVSVLTYQIVNPTSVPITNISFTDDLTANVNFANVAAPFVDCDGSLSLDGANQLSFSGGRLGGNSACTIQVNVTSTTVGMHSSTSSALLWNAGSSSGATASLSVENTRPGITLSFSPAVISEGGTSTMTVTIDNSQNPGDIANPSVSIQLPDGLAVAFPSNLTSNCGPGNVTASSGFISLSPVTFFTLNAGASCSFSVDVTALASGNFAVKTSDLTSQPLPFGSVQNSGPAIADLSVPRTFLIKSFINDPGIPGGEVQLKYTLTNLDRSGTASNIAFTDNLDDVITGMTTIGLPANACNGGTVSGTNIISYNGGTLTPGESCSFIVNLQIPAGAATGTFQSSSSAVTYDLGSDPVEGNIATDFLSVQTNPTISMEFIGDPIVPGGDVDLSFTITNTNSTVGLTGINFSEDFNSVFFQLVSPPSTDFCGTGSIFSYVPLSNPPAPASSTPPSIVISNGSLDPGGSCNFSLTLRVPQNTQTGIFDNTTSILKAMLAGGEVEGSPASDQLIVASAPLLAKSFTGTVVEAGHLDTIVFTLSYTDEASSDATAVAFTDNLNDFIPGAVAVEVVSQSCTGTVDVSNTSVINYSSGTLSPGELCTFRVAIQIPETTAAGPYTNTTSEVTSTINGLTTNSLPASAVLTIPYFILEKEFINDPVIPGGQVDLQFTITNLSDNTISNIQFNDNLNNTINGLTSIGLPLNDPCGAGSSLQQVGNSLVFSGGNVTSGNPCSFTVTLDVPATAPTGNHNNRTEIISGLLNGIPITGGRASDILVVGNPSSSLVLNKSFPENSVNPGDITDLKFEIFFEGAIGVTEVSNIFFSDDLGAALPGLQALTISDNTCIYNPLLPSGNINFSMSSLASGSSCSFTLQVKVPDTTLPGLYTNTTSVITADGGIVGDAASATLAIVLGIRPPEANAGGDNTYECTGNGSADVTLDGTGSTSNIGQLLSYTWLEAGQVIATGPSPTVSLGLGPHIITLQVADDAGTDEDEVEITVVDETDPTVTCPDGSITSFELIADQNCEAILPDYTSEAVASDNCSANVTLVQFPAPGTVLTGHGFVQPVTITADDGNGNSSSCSFSVTVQDTTRPVITILGDNPYIIYRFHPYVPAADPEAEAMDACDSAPTLTIDDSGVNVNLAGTYYVHYLATDEAGNSATAQRTIEVIEDPTVLAHDYLLLADQQITMGELGRLDGASHANAFISISKGLAGNKGGPSIYDSDLTAVQQITVARDNVINGNVTAPSISLANGVVIGSGYSATQAPVDSVDISPVNFSAGGSNVTVSPGNTLALSPGIYGNLLVGAGATLQLTTGDYFFTGITWNDEANIEIDIPTGPVQINSTTQMLIGEDINMSMTPGGDAESEYLKIQSLTDIFVGDNSDLLGQIIAPNGQVNIAENVQLRGSICARFININKGGANVIDHDAPSSFSRLVKYFVEETNALVRPNPFTHSVSISGEIPGFSDFGTVRILDLSNREIYRKQIQSKDLNLEINTGDWIPGMYFIMITSGSESEVIKVVKVE